MTRRVHVDAGRIRWNATRPEGDCEAPAVVVTCGTFQLYCRSVLIIGNCYMGPHDEKADRVSVELAPT